MLFGSKNGSLLIKHIEIIAENSENYIQNRVFQNVFS